MFLQSQRTVTHKTLSLKYLSQKCHLHNALNNPLSRDGFCSDRGQQIIHFSLSNSLLHSHRPAPLLLRNEKMLASQASVYMGDICNI